MTKSRWDPFVSGSTGISSEEPSISKTRIVFFSIQIFLTFVSLCCIASLAAFQAKWDLGVSGLNGFLIFLLFLLLSLQIFLLAVPLIFDRWDKLGSISRWLNIPRAIWIIFISSTLLSFLCALSVTISAFTQPGCKNPDDDPHEDKGDGFKHGLKNWCTTKKATAIFLWLLLASWLATMIHFFIIYRRQHTEATSSLSRFKATRIMSNWKALSSTDKLPTMPSSSALRGKEVERLRPEMAPKRASFTPLGQNEREAGYSYGYSEHEDDESDTGDLGYVPLAPPSRRTGTPVGRGSVDTYGAFDGDGMPVVTSRREGTMGSLTGRDAGGIGSKPGVISRTMLLASSETGYNDPYAAVRESLEGAARASQPPSQYQYSSAHY